MLLRLGAAAPDGRGLRRKTGMSRMNLVRSAISVLLVILVAIVVAGWEWAGGRPSPAMEGARFALSLCALASLACLGVLWRASPSRSKAR